MAPRRFRGLHRGPPVLVRAAVFRDSLLARLVPASKATTSGAPHRHNSVLLTSASAGWLYSGINSS